MARRTVSGYAEDKVIERLNDVAKMESRTTASVIGQAIKFYVALPESARASLRRIETMASRDEMRWFQMEFMRLLFKADMGLAQRRMAAEIGETLPKVASETEIEQAAVEWTNGLAR
jgi:predicted transcriptional regulator